MRQPGCNDGLGQCDTKVVLSVRASACLMTTALVLGLATACGAASKTTHMYTLAPTRACLASAGAKFGNAVNGIDDPAIKATLFLVIPRASKGFPWLLSVYFTSDPSAARGLVNGFVSIGESAGIPKARTLHATGRRGNVVWASTIGHEARPNQIALLTRCLR
jgi:hypothetical protein